MNNIDGSKRVFIKNLKPQVEEGKFCAKRGVGEIVEVSADIFADGHDILCGRVVYKKASSKNYKTAALRELYNDIWLGEFKVDQEGDYLFTAEAWIDHFLTWQDGIRKKYVNGQDMETEIRIGINLARESMKRAKGYDKNKIENWIDHVSDNEVTEELMEFCQAPAIGELISSYPDQSRVTRYEKELRVHVERKKASFSSWYELFPRSMGKGVEHGSFKDVEGKLADIKDLGFDVLYLPPIHPVGVTNRKGRNNNVNAEKGDPGSPWAIGSGGGGHKSIEPKLGSVEDFESLVEKARGYDIEIALDIAFQCSPDHPYVKEHPDWFLWRPDGTVQYAENPPKKYEDIIPINFETKDWEGLWRELKSVFDYWTGKGVRIFRVDNPHTKSFRFWQWCIESIREEHPEVIFLSEAFTRPKKMYHLAKAGFTQSYTYFTWRNTKKELTEYMTELTREECREFFRPNFWPNTPDILPEYLQYGGKPAFITRLVLAGTLSSNYGIYGPAYDLCRADAVSGKEEYLNSEKYEIKDWDFEARGNIRHVIRSLNRIRRENEALHTTNNIEFLNIGNDNILAYIKCTSDLSNIMLMVVNLDPYNTQSGQVEVPLKDIGIDEEQPFLVHDLFGKGKYIWQGSWNYVELNPYVLPCHIFRLHKSMSKETDFEQYF